MFCELVLLMICFGAFVAPERLFPTVRPHVDLQLKRSCASKVALVTLVWLLSCMLPHHVLSQINSLNTGILAH